MTATTETREAFRTEFNCPTWCTTSEADHRDDDAGRPIHSGHPLVDAQFDAAQGGDGTPVAYFPQSGDELTAEQCRELAAAATTAAAWIEGAEGSTVATCPSWCGHKAGHEYEMLTLAGEPARDHTRHVSDLGGHSVSVTAGALLTEAGEKVERPVVDLWLFGNGVEYPRHKRGMSATEARSLARFLYDGLNAAADLLDEIERD